MMFIQNLFSWSEILWFCSFADVSDVIVLVWHAYKYISSCVGYSNSRRSRVVPEPTVI